MPLDGINPYWVVVLDNCSIHHIAEVWYTLQEIGVFVQYLRSYHLTDQTSIQLKKYFLKLRLRDTQLKLWIIFGGTIIVLANKSTLMHGFASWSVSVMNLGISDYRKPRLNCVGRLSPLKLTTHAIEMNTYLFAKNDDFQQRSGNYSYVRTAIDRNKHYLGPVVKILWNKLFMNSPHCLEALSAAILWLMTRNQGESWACELRVW